MIAKGNRARVDCRRKKRVRRHQEDPVNSDLYLILS